MTAGQALSDAAVGQPCHQEYEMKKSKTKLTLNATTVRILETSLQDVRGGGGGASGACTTSHAPTCGNGSRCA
jgi:hypothetical protein